MEPKRTNVERSAAVWIAAALLLSLLPACSAPRPQVAVSRESGPIPVVRPFALERAGTHAEFEVELPNTREDGYLRSVFIGFRAVHDPRDPSAEAPGMRVYHYLDDQDIPVRLEVHRWQGGTWQPVTMVTMHIDDVHKIYDYRPHPDPVFRRHRPANWDGDELVNAGLWNFDLGYFEHEIAAFYGPTPGRYRIDITTLASHPALESHRYELVVAHRHRY